MKKGWMKNDEGWMKNDDFKLLRGFDLWRMDEQMDICDCRIVFATENKQGITKLISSAFLGYKVTIWQYIYLHGISDIPKKWLANVTLEFSFFW